MSSLDELARDAGAEVRDQVATIEPPTPDVIARRSRRGRVATGMAAVAVLALAGVGLAVTLQDDPAPTRLQVTDDPETDHDASGQWLGGIVLQPQQQPRALRRGLRARRGSGRNWHAGLPGVLTRR